MGALRQQEQAQKDVSENPKDADQPTWPEKSGGTPGPVNGRLVKKMLNIVL
jgi:hypothetical protein